MKAHRATKLQCQATVVAAAKRGGWRDPFPERIASRIDFNAPNECWYWTGELDRRGGYGALAAPTEIPSKWKRRKAHRLIYELLVGPIPAGLHLDHLCRTPRCVNPDHLEPVTALVNIRRGRAPTAVASVAGTCTQGHADDFCRRADGRVIYCRACRRERRARESAQAN